jgi:hypothetical protein
MRMCPCRYCQGCRPVDPNCADVIVAGSTRTAAGALALLCGVALGSASWFAVLTGVVALARQRVRGAWLVAVDVVSGLGLVAFVGALGVRTVQDV